MSSSATLYSKTASARHNHAGYQSISLAKARALRRHFYAHCPSGDRCNSFAAPARLLAGAFVYSRRAQRAHRRRVACLPLVEWEGQPRRRGCAPLPAAGRTAARGDGSSECASDAADCGFMVFAAICARIDERTAGHGSATGHGVTAHLPRFDERRRTAMRRRVLQGAAVCCTGDAGYTHRAYRILVAVCPDPWTVDRAAGAYHTGLYPRWSARAKAVDQGGDAVSCLL